jgi:hypothetical protein
LLPWCRVLPTSPEDGLIECVPSMALARVLAEHKSIHRYWALYNADPAGVAALSLKGQAAMLPCKVFCKQACSKRCVAQCGEGGNAVGGSGPPDQP